MKTILVTVVLGVAVVAAGQTASQPAQQPQGQPAASQGPVIKDPAEYNAYVGAIQQKDPAAQASGLEAFLTQYPNSIMKVEALKTLMSAYQQTGNQDKTINAATRLVQADPANVTAMALLAFFDRVKAQGGDPNGKALLADAKKYGQAGLDALPKYTKPEGMTDDKFAHTKKQMTGIFSAAIGIACLTDKDYPCAVSSLKAAVDATPDNQKDFSIVYPLALAYLQSTPPDYQDGIWFAARAAAVAPTPQIEPGIEKYAKSQYVKFHAGEDGWADVIAAAKANGAQMAIKPAPTPAEQAHTMALSKKPEEMDFAMWEFILSNGSQEDQDLVWNAIKGKPVQMNGTVISTTPSEFQIAGSSDDIDAKKPDITLKFSDAVPTKMIPKDLASFDFQGEPASYTPSPFIMVMENAKLLKAATPAPAKKPVRRKPATASQ